MLSLTSPASAATWVIAASSSRTARSRARVPRREDEVPAAVPEPSRKRESEPARGAGDERGFSIVVLIHAILRFDAKDRRVTHLVVLSDGAGREMENRQVSTCPYGQGDASAPSVGCRDPLRVTMK